MEEEEVPFMYIFAKHMSLVRFFPILLVCFLAIDAGMTSLDRYLLLYVLKKTLGIRRIFLFKFEQL